MIHLDHHHSSSLQQQPWQSAPATTTPTPTTSSGNNNNNTTTPVVQDARYPPVIYQPTGTTIKQDTAATASSPLSSPEPSHQLRSDPSGATPLHQTSPATEPPSEAENVKSDDLGRASRQSTPLSDLSEPPPDDEEATKTSSTEVANNKPAASTPKATGSAPAALSAGTSPAGATRPLPTGRPLSSPGAGPSRSPASASAPTGERQPSRPRSATAPSLQHGVSTVMLELNSELIK
jgi:hypothetical protein